MNKKILSVSAFLLIALSLFNLYCEIVPNRWLRIFTAGIFLLFSSFPPLLKKFPLSLVFTSLLLCDIFLLNWETPFAKHLYYIYHGLIFIGLLLLVTRKIKKPEVSPLEIACLTIFFLIISWILIILGGYFSLGTEDLVLEVFFYFNGFSIIFLVMCAFFYSTNYSNNISSFFFLAVLGLTISDLMLYSIYIMGFPEFRYIDNSFYVIGLFFLSRACQEFNLMKENKMISEEKSEDEKMTEEPNYQKTYY